MDLSTNYIGFRLKNLLIAGDPVLNTSVEMWNYCDVAASIGI
jgi:hypothetical protein